MPYNSKEKAQAWRLANPDKIKAGRKRYYLTHGSKIREKSKKWRNENPHRYKSQLLMNRFGISLAQYEDILKKQKEVCAICKQKETAIERRGNSIRKLAVDHDHKTGTVRGLLCGNCNVGLGKFKESIEFLYNAIRYLNDANI